MKSIIFGSTVRDKITGFVGIVTGKCSYITGCEQILVVPPAKDGVFTAGTWFDEQRLEQTCAEVINIDNGNNPGCDIPAPIK